MSDSNRDQLVFASTILNNNDLCQQLIGMIRRMIRDDVFEYQRWRIDDELLASVILEKAIKRLGDETWSRLRFNGLCRKIAKCRVKNALNRVNCAKRSGEKATVSFDTICDVRDPHPLNDPQVKAEKQDGLE